MCQTLKKHCVSYGFNLHRDPLRLELCSSERLSELSSERPGGDPLMMSRAGMCMHSRRLTPDCVGAGFALAGTPFLDPSSQGCQGEQQGRSGEAPGPARDVAGRRQRGGRRGARVRPAAIWRLQPGALSTQGGASEPSPLGSRAAFLRGLQRPPLKGAEEQLGTRTKRPGPPWRKEGASPRKQLTALGSACFSSSAQQFSCHGKQKMYILIPFLFGLCCRVDLLCDNRGEEASAGVFLLR